MPLEAMRRIIEAENEAGQAKTLAQQEAQKAVFDTISAGKEGVAITASRARSDIAQLKRAAAQNAADQAKELASRTANRQATLRARAERRLEDAAKLIIERIVDA